jgi:hypothetical protein
MGALVYFLTLKAGRVAALDEMTYHISELVRPIMTRVSSLARGAEAKRQP